MSIMNVEKNNNNFYILKGGSILSRRIFASLVTSTQKKREEKETNKIMKSKTKIIKTMLPSFFLYAKKSNH